MQNEQIKGDRVIWIIVILLSAFSLLTVYSSTGSLAYRLQGGNTEYYLIKQFIIVLLGIGLMFIAYKVNFRYFSRIGQLLFYISIPLLIYVIFKGEQVNGARREINFFGILFQPSDIAKLAIMLFIARFLAKNQEEIKSFKKGFLQILLPIILISGLILPGNFSTAAIVFGISIILLFIGRARFSHLLFLLLVGAFFFSLLWFTAKHYPNVLPRADTWIARIEAFFKPDKEQHEQVLQSKVAIATGGIIGKMPGNSSQRDILSHPYSDFIYAIIIEEYGLFGGFTIALFYLIFLFRSIRIARRCTSNFGQFAVLGISFLIVFQAIINMGVAVNLLPVTGQTLPFVSMGGTSFLFTCLGVGIILSVSKSIETKPVVEESVGYDPAIA